MKNNSVEKNDCNIILGEVMKCSLTVDFANSLVFQNKFFRFLVSLVEHNFDLLVGDYGKNHWEMCYAYLLKGVNDLFREISDLSLETMLKFWQV